MTLTPTRVPSKTFLIGEYAVLKGGPALVLTHPPYFRSTEGSVLKTLHPKSPAGSLLVAESDPTEIFFEDPHLSKGGFGGSTAEFIIAALKLFPKIKAEELYHKYMACFSEDREPSGADLVGQYSALNQKEAALHLFSKTPFSYEKLVWPFEEVSFLVFKSKSKVATHEHLKELASEENFADLAELSSSVIASFKSKDRDGFLEGTEAFTRLQKEKGLLLESSFLLLEEVKKLAPRGLLGGRACGALGADVFVFYVEAKESAEIKKEFEVFFEKVEFICEVGVKDFG